MIYSYARPFNDVWTNGPDPCNMIYTRPLPFRWKYGRFSVSNTIFFIKVLHILTENRSWLIIELLLIYLDVYTPSQMKQKYNRSNWFRSIRIQILPNEEENIILINLATKLLKWNRNTTVQIDVDPSRQNETEIHLFKLVPIQMVDCIFWSGCAD